MACYYLYINMYLPNVLFYRFVVPNGCIAVMLMFNTHDVAGQFFPLLQD